MRNNQPITQREYSLAADVEMVTVTDLKGQIIYCNQSFEEASGFSKTELLGQPHNMVRHPDMPSEAYRDMWETLQSGHSWTAPVKNRRKNGDHYWVLANARPLFRGENITGYISVRVPAQREQIEHAEILYATMRREAEFGVVHTRLHHGELILPGVLPALRRTMRLPVHWRLFFILALAALLAAVVGQMGWPLWLDFPVFLVLAALSSVLVYRMTVLPLRAAQQCAEQLSLGNLIRVSNASAGSGEWGQLLQTLSLAGLNVHSVVVDIRQQVQILRGAIAEVVAGNLDLSQRTESQASSLEEAAASMEQINSTVKHSTDSVARASSLAREASQAANAGDAAVHSVVETMQAITESSTHIGQIIQVIESVAFQTNILALNAAVEAARAGEQGRGFAVVAAEVRALAQRTTSAAQEIRALIETSHTRVEEGNQRTQDVRTRMQKILQAIESVSNLLSEVSTAASEQQIGVAQITEVVNQLDGITQQNAALVEEVAASSKMLEQEVGEVFNTTTIFRLSENEPSITDINASSLRHDIKSIDQSFSLGDSIASHTQVKIMLRNAVINNKKLDAQTLRRDDACALGHWIHGEGQHKHGNRPAFGVLQGKHKDFHRSAGMVADAVNAGQTDKVQRMLSNESDFNHATHDVVTAIQNLRREIG